MTTLQTTQGRDPRQRFHRAVQHAVVIGLIYFASAYLGLALFVVQPIAVAAVWPASGVLLAALLLADGFAWPLVLLSAGLANVVANLLAGNAPLISLGFAAANLLEALVAATLVRRWAPRPLLMDRLHDVIALTAIAVVGSNALTALLGATVVWASFDAPFWDAWRVWLIADGLGMLIFAPLALSWLYPNPIPLGRAVYWRVVEALALGCTLLTIGGIIFDGLGDTTFHFPYPLFPILVWAALRFHMRGASVVALILSMLVTIGTSLGQGPFFALAATPLEALLEAQQFLAIMVPCAYVMSALIAERTSALSSLSQANANLESQVAARTADLQQANQQLTTEITERIQAERLVRESEEQFRLLVDGVHDYAIFLLDPAGRIASWNSGAERLKGYTTADILGRPISCLYTPEDQERGWSDQLLQQAIRNGSVEDEGWRRHKDGSRFWAHVVISALHDDAGGLRGFVKVTHDDTERRRQSEALQAREAELAAIITSAMDAIITIDETHTVTRFNPAAEYLFRYSAADVIDQPLDLFIPPEYRAGHNTYIDQFGATNITNRTMSNLLPVRGLRSDGTSFPLEAAISQVAVNGRKLYTVILRDITTRVVAEETMRRSQLELEGLVAERTAVLAAALTEKETLLKEVHHRVKNNLQVISSLLWLQMRTLNDPTAIAALRESRQRVETMTLVHELLYRDSNLARIDAATYLRELSERLLQLFGINPQQIHVAITASGTVALEHAVPCGLIVTEAISNSLKYAFPDGRSGHIGIHLRQTEPETLELTITDDGIGLPIERSTTQRQSLGMRLIQSLVRQLQGTFSITGDAGVHMVVRFPALRAGAAVA